MKAVLLFARHTKMQAIRDTFSEAIKSLRWSGKDIYDLSRLTVLVIGATDGAGLECARELAAHHAHVIVHGGTEMSTSRIRSLWIS